MIAIPAVDIKGGKCVRLRRGEMDEETIFSDHPEEVAQQWEGKGAKRLHIVDLDGAVHGETFNIKTVEKVLKKISIPVQLGGGVRNLETISEYINMGIDKVILGTVAYKNPVLVGEACRCYKGKIIVSIDSKDDYISVEGWTEATRVRAIGLGKKFENMGVKAIIYTDINRDGMEQGPNIYAIERFAKELHVPVIAAGGISSTRDIEKLLVLEKYGVEGIIIGRALYTGLIDLAQANGIIDKAKVKKRDF